MPSLFATLMVVAGAIATTTIAGCGPQTHSNLPITVHAPMRSASRFSIPRIVCLAPSITEVLIDLKCRANIVGVTTADGRERLPKGVHYVGSLMQPSREAILACNPTLVIAVSGISGTSQQWLQNSRIPLLTVSTNSLKDVYQSIVQIGAVVNRRTLAHHIARQMREEIEAVNSVTTRLKAVRVLPLYQVSPIYTSTRSSFIANEIAAAGGTCMTAGVGEDGTTTSENVLQYQPQVILCDTRILKAVKLMPGWQTSVPAVTTNRYYWLNRDDEALVRPTPRIALAVEHLALFLHPHHSAAVSRAFRLAQRTFTRDKSEKKREAQ